MVTISPPPSSRPGFDPPVRTASVYTVSGTASAGDAHSLARRINPLQLVQCFGTEWLSVTENKMRQSHKTGVNGPKKLFYCTTYSDS